MYLLLPILVLKDLINIYILDYLGYYSLPYKSPLLSNCSDKNKFTMQQLMKK